MKSCKTLFSSLTNYDYFLRGIIYQLILSIKKYQNDRSHFENLFETAFLPHNFEFFFS